MKTARRILAIGEVEALAEMRRVLQRAEFDMHRVPAAQAATPMLRRFPFDLVIVVHPLPDTEFEALHRQVRAADGPSRDSQLLVLTTASRLPELDPFHRDPLLEVADRDQPIHRLAEVAGRYLGPMRAARRLPVDWPASWPSTGVGRTVDLSANGARLLRDEGELPPPGERGELVLHPPEGAPLSLSAEVARRIEGGERRGFAVSWSAAASGLERLQGLLAQLEAGTHDRR